MKALLFPLTQALALRIGRYLEGQGLLAREAENSYLAGRYCARPPFSLERLEATGTD